MEDYYALSVQKKLVLLGIFDNDCKSHVGNITLQELDWVNRRAFIGYLIGEKGFAGRGFASEACLMLLYYGFNKLNFDRIWTTVSVEHVASLKVAEKAGFKVEGRLREHQLRNGRRIDVSVVGALRQEWMTERGDAARDAFGELPI
jgi:ribosomal-protein-alanine N-acetyltransferase